MNLTWKLFVAHARQQKVRLCLTALAMIAAVGVVLWVVSAYEVIAANFDEQTDEFVGDYDVFVVPKQTDDELPAALITALQTHPAVQTANPVSQFRQRFRRVGEPPQGQDGPPGRRRGLGRMGPMVVGTTATESRYPLVDGRWLNPTTMTEAVVSSGVAEALSLNPGDMIEFQVEDRQTPPPLEVVGIVQQVEDVEFAMTRTKGGAPGGVNRGPASLAAYIPLKYVETLTGAAAKINLVELRLAPEATVDILGETVAAATPAAELLRREDVRAKLASGFAAEGARKQAYFVTALSILASAFIIFTTLSMGVNERARQLAILRAVGLRRAQVASLVLVEAFALAIFGWVGGLAGGWVLLNILASSQPDLFPNGVSLGFMSVILTGGCSLIGALFASVFPIWKATHISPLEAMAPLQRRPQNSKWYVAVGMASLLLIALNPALVYWPALPEQVRFTLILLVGVPTTTVGFILLAPLVVLLVEKVIGPVISRGMRLQSNLVRTQLSANMWRSAGIAASLTLGLGLYTATQVWGSSMLGGFLPGRWTPNTIVKFDPGLDEKAIEKVCQTTGVLENSCLPIAVEQTKLVGDPLQSGDLDSAVRQDNVTLIGLDAQRAFDGSHPLFQLKFIQGDRASALEKLKEGRHCLVPDSFVTYGGLNVGDRIGLIPPQSQDQPVEYTIAGVVSMPGSNWITKTSGLRRHFVRTAGIVFAPELQVREDFDLPKIEYFWLNVKAGVTADELTAELQPLVATPQRKRHGNTTTAPPRNATTGATVGRRPEGRRGGPGGRTGRRGGPRERPLQVTLLGDVRESLISRGGAAVSAMGWLPLVALIVVSLGIVNTIAASVRARRWEFGVLRAVGLKRFSLARLVMSEALLIGFVASILSLAFGILTGWTCLGLVRYVSNPWFEGVATPLVIPWSALAFGYALTFVLCIVAALWPAISCGRTEPLSLLQAGRAAT